MSISNKIYNNLLKDIYNGAYQIGDRLPSERNLAATYNVSKNTAREVLKKLQTTGLIKSNSNSGYVFINSINEGINNIIQSYNLIYEIQVLRRVIEKGAIDYIFEKRNIENEFISDLRNINLKIKTSPPIQSSLADYEFHYRIIKETKNNILTSLFHGLKKDILKMTSLGKYSGDCSEKAYDIHNRLIDAIEKLNYKEAINAFNIHYDLFKEYIEEVKK